jgi:hypothetical protein
LYKFAAIAACLIASALPLSCRADEKVNVFAGAQGDYAAFGFVGGTVALPGSDLGKGFAVRGAFFTGGYNYESGSTPIKASFTGEEGDLLYQVSSKTSWINFGAGARNANTSLTPTDFGNRRRGNVTEFVGSIDGGAIQGPWRQDFYASYGTFLTDYNARLSVTYAIGSGARFGVEGGVEGDPTYSIRRIGPYIGIRLERSSEMQLSGGISNESGQPSVAYGRLGISHSF